MREELEQRPVVAEQLVVGAQGKMEWCGLRPMPFLIAPHLPTEDLGIELPIAFQHRPTGLRKIVGSFCQDYATDGLHNIVRRIHRPDRTLEERGGT